MSDHSELRLISRLALPAIAALLSVTLAAPVAFGQAAGGYDVLEISPPSGWLARRAWLAEHGVSVDSGTRRSTRGWRPEPVTRTTNTATSRTSSSTSTAAILACGKAADFDRILSTATVMLLPILVVRSLRSIRPFTGRWTRPMNWWRRRFTSRRRWAIGAASRSASSIRLICWQQTLFTVAGARTAS